jgi:hypothetical protein
VDGNKWSAVNPFITKEKMMKRKTPYSEESLSTVERKQEEIVQ